MRRPGVISKRILSLVRLYLLTSILLLVPSSAVGSGLSNQEDGQLEELIERVRKWCAGLESFRGEYEHLQSHVGQADSNRRIAYRFQGDDRWVEFKNWNEGVDLVRTVYDGVFSERVTRRGGDRASAMIINGSADKWGIDIVDFMFPDMIYKWPQAAHRTKSMVDMLDEGHNFLFDRGGRPVLSHWDPAGQVENFDVYFAPDGRVQKIEWSLRFGFSSPMAMHETFPDLSEDFDVFALRSVLYADEFLEYTDFDGYPFPSYVERRTYGHRENAEAVNMARGDKPFSLEYVVNLSNAVKADMANHGLAVFRLDLATAEINTPLEPEDFEIPYDDSYVVVDASKSQQRRDVKAAQANLLDLVRDYRFWLALVLLFGGITLAVRYRKTRRSKA